jgi:hypothetical protein
MAVGSTRRRILPTHSLARTEKPARAGNGALYTLVTRVSRVVGSIPLNDSQSGPNDVDWLGGHWEDIGLWTPKSFFSRVERRVIFEL